MTRVLARAAVLVALVVALALVVARIVMGSGRVPDYSTTPRLPFDRVEKVADLDFPPGNIAVSDSGRVFLTLHPDGHPPFSVAELVDGRPVPFPDEAWQHPRPAGDPAPHFQSILSLRIDRRGRLWVLDFAGFGRGQPRLLAFDLATRALAYRHDFDPAVAGLGSMLNDLQVDPTGRHVFIAETSPVLQTPAILVHDTATGRSRRLLHDHASVSSARLDIVAGGRRMMLPGGWLPLRIAVDSIALSRDGRWLYYGAVTGDRLYRVPASVLADENLDSAAVEAAVEDFAAKPLTDGLTTDDDGGIYLSDMEHSAVHRMGPDGRIETIVSDPRLRWPDGFGFGPEGWLYVTCSALQDVLFRDADAVRAHAPYQVWRLRPGAKAAAGH